MNFIHQSIKVNISMSSQLNLPADEVARLAALRKLKILDSPYETLFDCIARAAVEICNTPIALITFVDEDRQWFKTTIGIEGVTEAPRESGFCSQTILQDGVLEVLDATLDERFKGHSMVVGNPKIRYYAGAPIQLPMGEKIGSLCVIDTQVNALNENQKAALVSLAKVISHALLIRECNTRANEKERATQDSVLC